MSKRTRFEVYSTNNYNTHIHCSIETTDVLYIYTYWSGTLPWQPVPTVFQVEMFIRVACLDKHSCLRYIGRRLRLSKYICEHIQV